MGTPADSERIALSGYDPVTDSDPACITIKEGEDDDCIRTQGYWKTHSKYGPAPYENTCESVGDDRGDSPFFGTGQSWYEVFWTEPKKGNAYYILAHQYIAAYLNALNGADTSDITDELKHAEDLLDQYDGNPKSMANIRGFIRYDFIRTAEVLDDYNNGDIGPGHCDDEDKET